MTEEKPVRAKTNVGRKPRVTVKKSRETATRIYTKGEIIGDYEKGDPLLERARYKLPKTATPLDVMIEAMRYAYGIGGPLAAFPYAEKAAPYLHAKISSIELRAGMPGQPIVSASSELGLKNRFAVTFVKSPPRALPPVDTDVVDV